MAGRSKKMQETAAQKEARLEARKARQAKFKTFLEQHPDLTLIVGFSYLRPLTTYSDNNVAFICFQCIEREISPMDLAGAFNGFQGWKNEGRHVAKGQSGFQIYAPIIGKVEDTDDEVELKACHLITVFDLSQTEVTQEEEKAS